MANNEGVCYRTTFGDWYCAITGGGGGNDSNMTEYKMTPLGGAKITAEDKPTIDAVKDNNKTTAAKETANENKDEKGHPKPDFSEMEKYYEIIRYEYNTVEGKLNIVAKMRKEVNPNDFEITFYDADGARLLSEAYVVWSNSGDRIIGDVHKFHVYLPLESVIKRVTKVVVTEHVY